MFFPFEFSRLFAAVAAFALLTASIPAYAASGKPEVEVDLSVLQNLPHRPQPVQLTPPPSLINNPAPVESTPLQPRDVPNVAPAQPTVSETAPADTTRLQPGDVSHPTAASARPPASKPIRTAEPLAKTSDTPAKAATPPKAKAVRKIHKAAVVKKKKKAPVHHRPPAHAPVHKPQAAKVKTLKTTPTTTAVTAPAKMPPPIDASAKNPATDDKKPAADIEDISEAPNSTQPPASTGSAPPQPVAIKTVPSMSAPAAPSAPVPPAAPLATAPEKSTPPAPVTAQPPAEKEYVPAPPPADPHETSHFSLPFKAGVSDHLDGEDTATLQSQILPMLKEHPTWRLRINAFATPVDSDPVSARRVSLARALAVRSWLLDKGVAARRMDVRAAGLETGHESPDRVDIVFLDPDAG